MWVKNSIIKFLFFGYLLFFIVSCAPKNNVGIKFTPVDHKSIFQNVNELSIHQKNKLSKHFSMYTYQDETKNTLSLQKSKQILSSKSSNNYDPILDKKISSFVFAHENYKTILKFIADQLNLNLIISKDVNDVVSSEKSYLTLSFHNLTVRQILAAISEILGISFKIKNGILFVDAYEQRIYDLGFLTTLRASSFDLGGDVLGGNMVNSVGSTASSTSGYASEIVNPLKGNFELKGKSKNNVTDIYKSLELNIKSLLSKRGTYTLNPYTGTLFVRDYVRNIREISQFIANLKRRYARQVLIEAKIIEVELSKEHQMGINWHLLFNNNLKDNLNMSAQSNFFWNGQQSFILQLTGSPYFDVIINALETFGHVRIISNPRLRVIHAQPAMISVGRSIAYIKEIQKQFTSSDNLTTVETNVQTSAVFDGLLFGVTPYIDNDNSITLHLIPITSNVISLQEKQFGDNYAVTLPQINLRETSTVIRVRNNSLVVIGGLILNRETSNVQGIPVLSSLPGLGRLFTHRVKNYNKVELVILLRVRLVS